MMVSEEKRTEEETWARYHLQGHILSTLAPLDRPLLLLTTSLYHEVK